MDETRSPTNLFNIIQKVVTANGERRECSKNRRNPWRQSGVFADEGVVKASFPRTELDVTIDSKSMHPFMGLTSWVSFQKGPRKGVEVMIMGDLFLFEDEVNLAMSTALANSIEITALHNHFFFDNPKIYFMHIGGEGNLEPIALGIRNVLDEVKALRAKGPKPAAEFEGQRVPSDNVIDGNPIEKILEAAGQSKSGMFKIVIGRKTKAGCGCIVGKNMGVNTWAAFGGNNENAVVCGDFALLEDELQAVLNSLRTSDISIMAIHNHMTFEQPRFIFIHYWGKGRAADLAHSLKSALDKTHESNLQSFQETNSRENVNSKCDHCD